MGYPGSEGQSPNVQGSNSPAQGGGPSPQGGSPSLEGGGGPSPQGGEDVYDTTVLANYLSDFKGQPMKNTGIRVVHSASGSDFNLSRIFLFVKEDHPEFFTKTGIFDTNKMTIKDRLVEDIRGLEKNYPDNLTSRKSPNELWEIAQSRKNN